MSQIKHIPLQLFLVLVALGLVQSAFAQLSKVQFTTDSTRYADSLRNLPDRYINDVNKYEAGPLKLNKINNQKRLNDKMMNVFFREEVGAIVHGSNDLNTQRVYFSLSNTNSEFSFGYNWDLNGGTKTDRLNWIISGGLKGESDGSFLSFTENGNFQRDNQIALTAKLSWIGRGVIKYGNNGAAIENYRKKVLKQKIQAEIDKYVLTDKEFGKTITIIQVNSTGDVEKEMKKVFVKTYRQFYEKFATEEIKAMKEFGWVKSFWDHYATFEFTVPTANRKYLATRDVFNERYRTYNFYAFDFRAQYTMLCKFKNKTSIYLSALGQAYRNNTLETGKVDTREFQTLLNPVSGGQYIWESEEVYIGEFDPFWSGRGGLEFILFPKNEYVGFSPSVQYVIGSYESLDWKLGLPVSLRDKEGKPKVNLEIQWKKTGENKLFGIRAGFVLGSFVG